MDRARQGSVSLAVLPFENLGDGEAGAQDYFSSGFIDDLISDLSRFPELLVLSAHSAARLQTPAGDAADRLAPEVDYLLEGSIGRSSGRLRIRTQLVHPSDARVEWAGRFDSALDDVLEVEATAGLVAVDDAARPAAIPGLHRRLGAGSDVRIADVGCGEGWSTIALARAYPDAEVVGYDLDLASIEAARDNAAEAGVDVRFVHGDAVDFRADSGFHLVLLLEALHDTAQPTEALRALRTSLADGGALLIADERAAPRFEAPGDEIERMRYGWSVSHCLPVAMSEQPSEAIGPALRPDVVARCARDAGVRQLRGPAHRQPTVPLLPPARPSRMLTRSVSKGLARLLLCR